MKKKHLIFIAFVLLIVTVLSFIVKTTIDCIKIYQDVTTSAPWYIGLILNSLTFIIPISLEIGVLLYLKSKK